MEVQIICPDAATSRLACEGFRSAWRSLHDQCTWATGYQTPEFATAWYRTYAPIAQPLLVIAESAGDKRLVGLLALAQERGSDRIMNVGDHQSEYHAWLANEEVDGADPFIVSALDALRARFPHGSLLFRYLPPGTPTGWLNGRGPWRASVTTRQVSRPLIRLGDGEQIEKTLRKKSNKSRLNRMCKAGGGELTSRTIETEAELATIIDDVARHYDLRQGAVNGVTPFHDDAFKKDFHLRLMRSGLMHAFVLRAGSMLASAILSMKSDDSISVGVFAHSVDLAPHSPGKFAMLFLSRQVLQDGYRLVDLTPGGAWKERFANDSDSVLEMTVWFDRGAANRAKRGERVLSLLKRSLALFGLTPQSVRNVAASFATLRRATPAAIVRRVGRWAWTHDEFRVYYFDAEKAASLVADPVMQRDNIDDLLRFEATSPWMSRTGFLGRALEQMETGSHIYTAATGDRLDHYGWMTERSKESYFSEVDARFVYPPNSAVLFDFHTHPAARGRGLYQQAIVQMLKDAAAVPGIQRVYVSVLADNRPSRHVIEKLGFVHACSLHRWSRFGHTSNSREDAADGARTLDDAKPSATAAEGQ